MTQTMELKPLGSVIEHILFVKRDIDRFEFVFCDILATLGGFFPLLGAVGFEQA